MMFMRPSFSPLSMVSLSYNEVSAALVNHELRRKNKESSNSTSAEALTVRGRSSNRKDKGDHGRSKYRTSLKKNQHTFCREEGYWKVNCQNLKGKDKSKPEANIAQVKSSQVDGSDSDSLIISFMITTLTIFYSEVS